jgi:glucose/arabinose dehydrogenase
MKISQSLTKATSRSIFFVGIILAFLVTISFIKSNGPAGLPKGDPGNGGIVLPGGFEAVVVADTLGPTRHIAVNTNGDIYIKLRNPRNGKGSIALRDNNNDGKADIIEYFGDYNDIGNYGNEMKLHNGYLYFATAGEIYRIKLTPGKLVPEGKSELVLTDDYKREKSEHIAKSVTFDNKGNMYVPFGSPTDVCRIGGPETPGKDPCPELVEHAGVWKFSANKLNQTQKDGTKFATGLRSTVGMQWNDSQNALYLAQHGRDAFYPTWPKLYNAWDSALLPSEEFLRITEGSDVGWPYVYYDFMKEKLLVNPEYGGDGKKEADPKYLRPLVGFPGHFAPNDILFYTGNQFPARYKNGAFLAFHGSTIRAPYPQGGYCVAFVPMKNGRPSGTWELFADGFGQVDTIVNTRDAVYRPTGLAQGPDGSLYITESEKGRVWRVMYKGDKNKFTAAQLASMAKRKETSPNIKNPDIVKDNLTKRIFTASEKLYNTYCAMCHQGDGRGDGTRFPPLANSEYVKGDATTLINIVLNGLGGPITVDGVGYNGAMPPQNFLKDQEISMILTYIRQSFGNKLPGVQTALVSRIRNPRPR